LPLILLLLQHTNFGFNNYHHQCSHQDFFKSRDPLRPAGTNEIHMHCLRPIRTRTL